VPPATTAAVSSVGVVEGAGLSAASRWVGGAGVLAFVLLGSEVSLSAAVAGGVVGTGMGRVEAEAAPNVLPDSPPAEGLGADDAAAVAVAAAVGAAVSAAAGAAALAVGLASYTLVAGLAAAPAPTTGCCTEVSDAPAAWVSRPFVGAVVGTAVPAMDVAWLLPGASRVDTVGGGRIVPATTRAMPIESAAPAMGWRTDPPGTTRPRSQSPKLGRRRRRWASWGLRRKSRVRTGVGRSVRTDPEMAEMSAWRDAHSGQSCTRRRAMAASVPVTSPIAKRVTSSRS
jgi:hypothetical protein